MNKDMIELLFSGIWETFLYQWSIDNNVDIDKLFKEKKYSDSFYSKAKCDDYKSQLVMFYAYMREFFPFKKDNVTAMYWLIKAANGGLAEAQYLLAEFKLIECRDDDNNEKNKSEACFLLEKSAHQGLVEAQSRLAEIYESEGYIDKSRYFNKMAAVHDDPKAIINIADESDENENYEEAFKKYMFINKLNSGVLSFDRARAKYKLAQYYATGLGSTKSIENAINFYKELAFEEKFEFDNYYVDYRLNSLLILIILALSGECDEYINEDEFEKILNTFDKNNFLDYFIDYANATKNDIKYVLNPEVSDFLLLLVDEIKETLNCYFEELDIEVMLPGYNRGIRAAKTLLLNNIVSYKKLNIKHEELDRTTKELEENKKQLERESQEKEKYYKIAHEKEKEMLSFFTHTMRNALSSAPESLRQAIRLLGSEDYEKNKIHYEAINEITALFSTLSLVDCLVDTFKQSIYDPEKFKLNWEDDNTGEATPQWFIAAALRQSLNRIIFISNTRNLIKLLQGDVNLIKPTRKSFIEQVLPLDIDQQGVESFYQWLNTIPAIDISIEEDTIQFGVNQIKFSLLFSITSELIFNALKYWSGTGQIQIRWFTEQDYYIFTVKNDCRKNASSNLAGTHQGLAFIKRLMELLDDKDIKTYNPAQFTCFPEEHSFTAELKLHKTLLENNS